MTSLRCIALAAGVTLVAALPSARANCVEPTNNTPLAAESVGASALSPSAPHPTLGRTVVAAGTSIYLRTLGTLAAIGEPLDLGGTVEGTPNPVQLDNGSYGAFVSQADGFVTRINPEGSAPTRVWSTDLKRALCDNDGLSATPAVHLNRYASAAFQAQYDRDLVYVATRYDPSCFSGNANNRIYALDAESGEPVWIFNEDGAIELDATYEAPYLDYASDRLVVGTDRTLSLTQDSLWSINLISGARAWSSSVGQIYASPQVRDNRVYVATLFGEIKAVSMSDGAGIWSLSNGGIPITANIFREFRSPFGEVITAVDYNGDVWMVLDNGDSGHSIWTASLADPVTGVPTKASSRVATDPGNGKLYVGAEDGQVYQLNLVDGSVEATRRISADSAVGGASFVFEGADVNMVAGAADGSLAKLCAPWAAEAAMSPLQPDCTDDSQCAPDDPNPTTCSSWACVSGVCVARPNIGDGQSCTSDGNADTFDDSCNAGICMGASTCEQDLGSCFCNDHTGSPVNRALQVDQQSCGAPPAGSGINSATWCTGQVSALVAQSDCLAHGSGAQTALWIHLFDQDGRPFVIDPAMGSVVMSMSGGAGTPPQFLSPATLLPTGTSTASLASNSIVASPNRDGTYYAYLGAQGISATPSGGTPWTLQVQVQLNNGGSCIDTAGQGQTLTVPITMGHVESQACALAPDAIGSLELRVSDGGSDLEAAPVRIGNALGPLLAQDFEESILGAPSGANTAVTDASGLARFTDFGNYLSGSLQVSATCPGGTIGDANTQIVSATNSSVDIALDCSPASSAGHVTYQVSDIYRVEAVVGATPVNISDLLDPLGTESSGDSYPATSRNGQWMTLVSERFDSNCVGWSCMSIVNSDFSVAEVPWIGGAQIHPEGRTAISNDGTILVYFDDGPSHQADLFVSVRSGGSWSAPLNLTVGSPHTYNNQPVLSYDNSRVLFDCGPIAWGQDGTGVCEVALDGSGFIQLVHPVNSNPIGSGSPHQARHADYAPDGSIVFEASWDAEQLWRLTSPGATPTQIIPDESNDNSPCVLPNGKIVSLYTPHQLKLTEADGSSSALILPGSDLADIGISCHE